MKPSIRLQPDHFIAHVGTNDLIWNTSSNEITRKVVDIAEKWNVKNAMLQFRKLYWERRDKTDWSTKGYNVNTHLTEMCKEQNIFLIDYSEKIKENHLNSSNLHLNRGEAKILSTSFLQYISKIFKWQLAGNSSDCNFSTFGFEKYGWASLKWISKLF